MIAFADTCGLAAFADERQTTHTQALDIIRRICDSGGRLVTTNYVLAELTALLTRPIRMSRPRQIKFLDTIRSADWIEIVHIDTELDDLGWRLWRARPDKTWSLVDCASFVVMARRGIADAITADHQFEQAGFHWLLKPAIP